MVVVVSHIERGLNYKRNETNKKQIFLAKNTLTILLGWLRFYVISTIVDYLMLNTVYTYILNIYDLFTHFVDNILKPVWAVIWFQVFLSNLNDSIQH